MRRTKYPQPLSPTGYGVRLDGPPEPGEVFYGIAKRNDDADEPVNFFTVLEVQPYTRKSNGAESFIVLFKDQHGNHYTSGLSTARMKAHGKKRPPLADPFDTALARPIGPRGMSVRHDNVPAIGEVFWTFPENDNTKQKLYVKVTEVRPFTSPADGTQQYRIYYTCKDKKMYASNLSSYKLVNLTDDDKHERAIKAHREKANAQAR